MDMELRVNAVNELLDCRLAPSNSIRDLFIHQPFRKIIEQCFFDVAQRLCQRIVVAVH